MKMTQEEFETLAAANDVLRDRDGEYGYDVIIDRDGNELAFATYRAGECLGCTRREVA